MKVGIPNFKDFFEYLNYGRAQLKHNLSKLIGLHMHENKALQICKTKGIKSLLLPL